MIICIAIFLSSIPEMNFFFLLDIRKSFNYENGPFLFGCFP